MKLSPEMTKRVLALAGEKPVKAKRKQREVVTDAPVRWSVTLEPACRVVTETNTLGAHWTVKAKRVKAQQEQVNRAWRWSPLGGSQSWTHLRGVTVTLTHIGPRMDDDNLQAAFKAVRDEVARLIGVDDGDEFFTWDYRQETGGKGIRITIENRT